MNLKISLSGLLIVAVTACTDATAPEVVGVWGGVHVRLEVTNSPAGASPSPGGTLEFDCAHGGLTESLLTDKSGRFDVAGYYVQEHGGPVRVDEVPNARPARYFGEINGSRMTLTVTRTDTTWSAGPFTLDRGRGGSVFKCL